MKLPALGALALAPLLALAQPQQQEQVPDLLPYADGKLDEAPPTSTPPGQVSPEEESEQRDLIFPPEASEDPYAPIPMDDFELPSDRDVEPDQPWPGELPLNPGEGGDDVMQPGPDSLGPGEDLPTQELPEPSEGLEPGLTPDLQQ